MFKIEDIRRLRKVYLEKIKYWNHRLQDLQDECPHEKARKVPYTIEEPKSFWLNCTCADCGKIWTEAQP